MLVLSSALFLLIAGSAAAADETAPIVDVPEDVPGADVIVFFGDAYEFDASNSIDDTGIVSYQWDFMDNGTPVMLTSTTGKVSYTFIAYGSTWVTVHAWDAAGNEGLGYFAIDVVEVYSTDTIIQDQVGSMTHSLYLDNADLTINNSTLYMDDGAGVGPHGGSAGAPDLLAESVRNDGDFAGTWRSLYDSWYYGSPVLDTNTKLSGDASIRTSGGYYRAGFEYIFDSNVDLSGYNAFSFWLHSTYYSSYNYMYYVYFYSSTSSSRYMRAYAGVYQQGGYSVYRDWYAYTVPLDIYNTGRWYTRSMYDLSSVKYIRIETNFIYGSYYSQWIDNVGFYTAEWADHMTESTNPGGDHAGRWSSSYSSPYVSSNSYVGDYSVAFPMGYRRYVDLYYDFSSPTDLSWSKGMRYFNRMSSGSYAYYQRSTKMRVWDADGGYAYYYGYSSARYWYGYGRWYMCSYAFGPGTPYRDYGIDWTKITRFSLEDFYTYYPSYSTQYIDGLEFYSPGSGGGEQTDSIPVAIYVKNGDLTIDGDSHLEGIGKVGGRIYSEGGNTRIQHATFDNIWHTEYDALKNGLKCYGGVEVYGDAVIDNVTFTNCMGPGLALYDGDHRVDRETVDLHGTTQKVKEAPMLIMGVTDRTTGNVVMDVSGWSCDGSPGGTGILVSAEATDASITITIHNNDVDGNGYAGIVISNYGGLFPNPMQGSTTNDLNVIIKDQLIEDAGSYGIAYYAGGGTYDPNVWGTLWIENTTVRKSGEAGLGVQLDMGGMNLDATIVNSTFERNSGVGGGFLFTSFFGECRIDIENTSFRDNSDSGLYISSTMQPWDDGRGNVISPVGAVDITINGSSFQANSGWGIVEDLNGFDQPDGGVAPPWTWSGPTRTTLWYNITMTDSEVLENQAGGWMVNPSEGWTDSDQVTVRDISGTLFTDNRGPGFYSSPEHDLSGGGSVNDANKIHKCRIIDNQMGVDIDMGNDNYGYYGTFHILDTRLTNNDNEAIHVDGSWSTDGIFRWGYSRVLGLMVHVDGCNINTPLVFNMLGADDSLRDDWDAMVGLQFTNNKVDIDEEVTQFHLGAYQYCEDFTVHADIGGNKFFREFIDNGMHLEMFGGWNMDMDATIYDQVIDTPGGSGVHIRAGTLVPSTNPHQIGGKVMVDNVTIEDAVSNGINFTVEHREMIGAKSLARLEVHDVMMENVESGIVANDAVGAVYDTQVLEPRGPAVNLVYSTFDFYSCDVGPVDTANIIVRTKGAARLWYDLNVDVKWASGERVIGAVVQVQDNTWSTIAVNTVVSDEVLPIGYVNSYTVLPDTVYSKSPFLMTGTYLGLTTEKMVDIKSNIIVDLILVDDVLPRLTVNTPLDGSKQRETSLMVKGHAWDQHSGLSEVLVSINDGFDWHTATGEPNFEYMFNTVPEGNLMVWVKAVDQAGNERVEMISVLVDATPPPIIIIEPQNDVILTQDPVLNIVGVTELGATVLINNEEVALDLTLFRTTLDLTEGMNEVRIVALDRLGNSAVHVIDVELDTIAPPLIVTAPMAGEVLGDTSVEVHGQTEAGARVHVNDELVANQMGMFSHTAVLSEGPNVIVVTSEDMAGNKAMTLVEVSVDTTAPWLRLASPVSGDVFGTSGINVIGWVEQGSIVKVNDQEVDVTDSHFSVTIMGSEGMNVLKVTVIDMAGNEYSESVDVWFDTTAPTIELWTPEDGLMTSEDAIEVTGMLHWNEDRESFRDITLTINGDFAPFAADGEFHVQYELVEGTNPLFIRATDDVGNSMVHTVTVTKDSIAPFLLVEPTPTFDHETWDKPSTYEGLVYIDGVTEPGAMVTVDGAGVEVDEAGRFNVSILLDPVPEGEELVQRTVVVVATDGAGNSKDETVEVYRLKEEVTDPGFMEYDSAQYWVLLLSIIILVVAIVAAAFLWRRIGAREEEYEDDIYLEEV